MLIISITGTDSPETISVAAHINAVCRKGKTDRIIDIIDSCTAFSCQTSRCCSCGIILHQIGRAILCRIAACNTCSSAPISFIRKIRSISCRGSDSFVGCSTWFAILVSIHKFTVNISVTAIRVHRSGAAVYNRGKQPQSLGRGYRNIQASTCIAYLKVICSCCQSRNGIVFIRVIYRASFCTGIAIQYTSHIRIVVKIISTI